MIKFSIIIPAFQSAQTLENCLGSIERQSYYNWEAIVIDDGSCDSTYEIASKWSEKDSRIRSFKKKNGGVSETRNMGIAYATGDYLMFLDSDDELMEDSLIYVQEIIQKSNCDVLVAGYHCKIKREVLNQYDVIATIEERDYLKVEYDKIFWNLFSTNLFHNIGTKIYRTSLIKKNNIQFEKQFSFFEDVLFCLNALKYTDDIYVTHKVIYIYHLEYSNSLSKGYHNNYLLATNKLYSCISELTSSNSHEFINSYADSLVSVMVNEVKNKNNTWKKFRSCAKMICQQEELKKILLKANIKDKKRKKIVKNVLIHKYGGAYLVAYSIYIKNTIEESDIYNLIFTFLYKIYKSLKLGRIKQWI